MKSRGAGSVYPHRGAWYVRVFMGAESQPPRPAFALSSCTTEEQAQARGAMVADAARELRKAGRVDQIAHGILERLAAADNDKRLDAVRDAVAAVVRGEVRAKAPAPMITIREFGEQWTSGELHRRRPEHVKLKSSARTDEGRLRKWIYPLVGDVPVAEFTIEDAERVMGTLPLKMSDASRRHVAQIMYRLLRLAVFPFRLRATNPLPEGFLPQVRNDCAKQSLYPDEDAKLLAASTVPLSFRVFYGALTREGFRSASEALALRRRDVDLDREVVHLDENKTDDPRAWALSPGVASALRVWLAIREEEDNTKIGDDDPLFVLRDENGEPVPETHAAERFRKHLQVAGISRPQLFARGPNRRRIWLHDLRATFVTISLANGKSETWVADRTGHKSSAMIQRYRRAARLVEELQLGELQPLVDAIPELAARAAQDADQLTPAPRTSAAGDVGAPRTVTRTVTTAIEPVEEPTRSYVISSIIPLGTEGGTRTHKPFRVADFESAAFAIPPLRLASAP